MALKDIPFYGGWNERGQQHQQEDAQKMKQAAGLMNLAALSNKMSQEQKRRELLAGSGGDIKGAIAASIKAGDIDGAHKLATLAGLDKPMVVGPDSALVDQTGKSLYTNPQSRTGHGTQVERAYRGLMELQKKSALETLTPDEDMNAQVYRAILSQERVYTDPVTQQTTLIKPMTIPSSITVGLPQQSQAAPVDAGLTPGPRPMPTPPGAPPNTAPRKAIDQPSEKELQGFNDASKQMQSMFNTFQPTYGGWALDPIASVALAAGRRLPETLLERFKQQGLSDQATWWQNYYNWANDIRAAKFGLTLTGNELQAFERATPKPSDDPQKIQDGLQSQMQILADKQKNRVAGLEAGGFNMGQVKATAGPTRQAFNSDAEALEAVRSGQVSSAQVAIPKEVFRMPKSKEFNIDGLRLRGTLRADGKYYVTQGGKTFRVEE